MMRCVVLSRKFEHGSKTMQRSLVARVVCIICDSTKEPSATICHSKMIHCELLQPPRNLANVPLAAFSTLHGMRFKKKNYRHQRPLGVAQFLVYKSRLFFFFHFLSVRLVLQCNFYAAKNDAPAAPLQWYLRSCPVTTFEIKLVMQMREKSS